MRTLLLRRLEALGHLEVLDTIAAGPETQRRQLLGARSWRCFRALHRPVLQRAFEDLTRPGAGASTADGFAWRGRLGWLLGRVSQARGDLDRALELSPRHPEALGYLGALWMAENPELSLRYLKRAAQAAPEWSWPHLWSAASYIRLAAKPDLSKALAELDRFLDLENEKQALAFLLKAFAHLSLRDHRRAVQEADAFIKADPASGAGYGVRAMARLALGDQDEGFADHDRSRDREPNCGFDILDVSIGAQGPKASKKEHLEMLNAAIASHPRRACFYADRAEILRGPGFLRHDLALEDYRRADALAPDSAWIQAHMARAEGEAAGLEKSLDRLDRAAALFPKGGWIFAWRGQTLKLLGRGSQALRDLDRAIAAMPWYPYSYAWKGALLASRKRWPQALACLDAALDMEPTYPTNALAFHCRSLAKRAAGDMPGAVEDATKAFLLDGKYEWVATAARPAAESECLEALRGLDRLLEVEPRHAWALAWRGRTRLILGRLAEAVGDLSHSLEIDGTNAWARLWRGLAYDKLAQADFAAADFRSALRLKPGLWPAAAELARRSLARGRLREALGHLRRAKPDAASSALWFAFKGDVLLRLGRTREARDCLKRAVGLNKSDAQAHDLMARAWLKSRDPRSALREAESALALKPELVTALITRGMARGLLGDGAGRIDDFRKAYRLDSELFQGADDKLLAALQ